MIACSVCLEDFQTTINCEFASYNEFHNDKGLMQLSCCMYHFEDACKAFLFLGACTCILFQMQLLSCAQPNVRKVGLAPRIFKIGAALRQWSQIWTGNAIGRL